MIDLIVKSKIKAAVPNMNVSGDVADALNEKIEILLKQAAGRAKANGRRTVQARDL